MVVSNRSKIEILKAIHNSEGEIMSGAYVVSNRSKIEILKAIHNNRSAIQPDCCVVSNRSKIEILKAIHNPGNMKTIEMLLLAIGQR